MHWIYQSQIIIAIANFCLCALIFDLVGFEDFYYQVAVGLLCFFSYHFQEEQRPKCEVWIYKISIYFVAVSFIYLATLIIKQKSFYGALILIVVMIMSIFYKPILRKIRLVKTPVISLSWALLIVLPFPVYKLWITIPIFFFIFAITLPFDIRDLEVDKGEIVTFPYLLGVPLTIAISFISIFIWSYFLWLYSYCVLLIFLIGGIASVLFFYGAKKRPAYYYYIFLDGLPILYYLLYLAYNNL